MRAITFTSLITCLIFLFSCKKGSVNTLEDKLCNIPKPTDTYDYPVKPGTTQWATFTNGQQTVRCLSDTKLFFIKNVNGRADSNIKPRTTL